MIVALTNVRCTSGRSYFQIGVRDDKRCGEQLLYIRDSQRDPEDKNPAKICGRCDGGAALIAGKNA